MLLYENAVSEGGNRNNACTHATGDVFITHDADDLPHPQRIEIIKWFFENYHIDHLRHTLVLNKEELDTELPGFFNIEEISWFHPSGDYRCWSIPNVIPYGNGQVAISRKVFHTLKWSEAFTIGMDVEFNRRVYTKFPSTIIVLEAQLYLWRQYLSSYKG